MRVCSYNLYATPFLSLVSHLTLVKFIKLKRTRSVCTREKEREKERYYYYQHTLLHTHIEEGDHKVTPLKKKKNTHTLSRTAEPTAGINEIA
jgi:hypothetical protein